MSNTLTMDQVRAVFEAQVFDADHPGTILRDFQTVLDYVGPKGIEANGKYHLLPIGSLPELDARLSRPLNLPLKRQQLRSHPYLQGIHLLLRSTGIVRVEHKGSTARLVTNPPVLAAWEKLNPTERYFNLLEAWLLRSRSEMVGERGRGFEFVLAKCVSLWRELPAGGRSFQPKRAGDVWVPRMGREFRHLALMDLFGLVSVKSPNPPVAPWYPARIDHTPFGDAFFNLFLQRFDYMDLLLGDVTEEDEEEQPDFGAWQPIFGPYFPAWKNNLSLPEVAPRKGVHVFRVSLGAIWRRIAIPADATLDDLMDTILDSVRFDNDHLYEFSYTDRLGAKVEVGHPASDDEIVGTEVTIGELPLEVGDAMSLVYDFGDSWKFTVTLESVDEKSKLTKPKILEKHGKSPEQYPNSDW